MPLPTVSLLVLRAADLDACVRFYSALGLRFSPEKHGSGPTHFSCAMGDLVLELYPLREGAPPDASTMIGLRVADLDEALALLKKLHAEPKSPPSPSEWGRWASVVDPDGRTVRLSQA